MKKLKESIKNCKVQCSNAYSEASDIFKSLGIFIPKSDFLYINSTLKAEAVSPEVFSALDCKELSLARIKSELDEVKRMKSEWRPGDICKLRRFDIVGVVVKTYDNHANIIVFDGTIVTEQDTVCTDYLITPSDDECSNLAELLKSKGYKVTTSNKSIDLFWLRSINQIYWAVVADFEEGNIVKAYHDKFYPADDYNYSTGNYFKSKQDAIKALQEAINRLNNCK